MRSLKLVTAVGLASAMMIAGTVNAKVSEEEAARLDGKDLTPLGGEMAGNADGSIPAWNRKWTGLPPGLEYGSPGEQRPNPYADAEPVVIITADNYTEHKDNLSEGQLALFARYPKYEIHAYPSHRDFGFQERIAGQFVGSKFKAGHKLEKIKKISKKKTGTRVRFWPDLDIFDPEAAIDVEEICARATQSCFLVPGMKVNVTDKRTGGRKDPFSFVSRGGLGDLVDHLSIGENVSPCNRLSNSTGVGKWNSAEFGSSSLSRCCRSL